MSSLILRVIVRIMMVMACQALLLRTRANTKQMNLIRTPKWNQINCSRHNHNTWINARLWDFYSYIIYSKLIELGKNN